MAYDPSRGLTETDNCELCSEAATPDRDRIAHPNNNNRNRNRKECRDSPFVNFIFVPSDLPTQASPVANALSIRADVRDDCRHPGMMYCIYRLRTAVPRPIRF